METNSENWIESVRAGILAVRAVYGAKAAAKAVVVMAPITASRGLLLCGLTDIADLEARVGARIFLAVDMPPNEYEVLDGEKLARITI